MSGMINMTVIKLGLSLFLALAFPSNFSHAVCVHTNSPRSHIYEHTRRQVHS